MVSQREILLGRPVQTWFHVCSNYTDPWWEVNLEEATEITQVCIFNRVSTNQFLVDRFSNFYLLISCEPFDENESLETILEDPDVYSLFIEETVGFPSCYEIPRETGQYVRIQKPGTKPLHFGEVEVYGCTAEEGCGPSTDPCASLPQPMIEPIGPFRPSDGLQQVEVNIAGGVWAGPISSTGVFDPSIGVGTYQVKYELIVGECQKSDSIEIVVQEPGTCEPTNMALNKPALQSSTYGNGVASIAVDGDLDGTRGPWNNPSIQHTQNENSPWWKVDLEVQTEIKTIEIYNRADCCGNRLRDFYVFVSNEPIEAGNSLNSLLSDTGIKHVFFQGFAGTVEALEINLEGRYVAVKLEANSLLHMAEVRVIGCPSTPSVECAPILPEITLTPSTTCDTADGAIMVEGENDQLLEFSLAIEGPWLSSTGVTFDGLQTGTYTLFVRDPEQPVCMQEFPIEILSIGDCDTECSNPINLTEGATAAQSSTYGNGSPDLAIDGDLIGESPWSANLQHTRSEPSPWWKVSLAEVAILDELVIYNRTNCCTNRLKDFYVFVSEGQIDGSLTIDDLIEDPSIEYRYFPGIAGARESFNLNGIRAKEALIKLISTGTLHMAEVELMGCVETHETNRFAGVNTGVDYLTPISVEAFPNPFSGGFNLIINGDLTEHAQIKLINALGQVLESRKVVGNTSHYLGENLAKGMYFVHLVDGKEVRQLKVVKIK